MMSEMASFVERGAAEPNPFHDACLLSGRSPFLTFVFKDSFSPRIENLDQRGCAAVVRCQATGKFPARQPSLTSKPPQKAQDQRVTQVLVHSPVLTARPMMQMILTLHSSLTSTTSLTAPQPWLGGKVQDNGSIRPPIQFIVNARGVCVVLVLRASLSWHC